MTLPEFLSHHHKTHLIFDFDETLFWLVMDWNIFISAMQKNLAPLDPVLYADFVEQKISLTGTLSAYSKQCGAKVKQQINAMALAFEEQAFEQAVPNPDLIDFVRANRDRYQMTIWSSNTSNIIGRVLEENNLSDVFIKVVSLLDVALLKPYPDGFASLRVAGVPLEHYLMIGNSQADAGAAKAVGIDYFHVDYFSKKSQSD